MKAVVLKAYGENPEFSRCELAKPEPGPGEVLIRVAGSSFNPIDNKIATLGEALAFAPKLPAVPSMDVSGEVVSVGEGVSRFRVGDRVFGCAGGVGELPGALAEYMVADPLLLAKAPESMDLADAAAMPLVATTAWLGLFDKVGLKRGQTQLVQGGAGGVGHMAVQLGVHVGARVFATVSGEDKAAVVEALGATPINYHDYSVDEYVKELTDGKGFDVVYDTVGGPTLDASFEAAAISGQVVSTVTRSTHDLSTLHAKSLSLHVVFMLLPIYLGEGRALHGEVLANMAGLVDEDALAVLLDEKRFTFDEVAEAHRYWESGESFGKISLVPDWG